MKHRAILFFFFGVLVILLTAFAIGLNACSIDTDVVEAKDVAASWNALSAGSFIFN